MAFAAAEELSANSAEEAQKAKAETFADYNLQTGRLRDNLIRFVTAAKKDLGAGSPQDETLNESETEILELRTRAIG